MSNSSRPKFFESLFRRAFKINTFIPKGSIASGLPDYQSREVLNFFKNLDLPLPRKDEWFQGSSDRRLVFLNDEGLVLRITPEHEILTFDHQHFLKPLFQRRAAGLHFAIDPGIDCPVPESDASKIYRYLREEHRINVADSKAENLGYLPGYGRKHPLMIDLDWMISIGDEENEFLARSVILARKLMGHKVAQPEQTTSETEVSTPDPQDIVYGDVRKMISNAWKEGIKTSDPEGIKAFFETCRDYKQEGRLLTRWQSNDYFGTAAKAALYAQSRAEDSGPRW